MAKHLVKCAICGETFDTNIIQAVKHGARRYAHYKCEPSGELVPLGEKTDPELQKLKDYINQLFGDKANWALINKQIKKFKETNGYSYSGMLKSLVYFFDVKHNSIDKTNGGIGIIEYCYQDAYNYYYNLFMAQQANKDKSLLTQIKEIIIKPPQKRGTKRKLFDLGEFEDEE